MPLGEVGGIWGFATSACTACSAALHSLSPPFVCLHKSHHEFIRNRPEVNESRRFCPRLHSTFPTSYSACSCILGAV